MIYKQYRNIAMKATRPEFIPITLTLETQHEVDAVFALLNHLVLSQAVGLRDLWKTLEPYAINDLYDRLDKTLKKCYETSQNAGKLTPISEVKDCTTCRSSSRSCSLCRSHNKWKSKLPKSRKRRKRLRVANEDRDCQNCFFEHTRAIAPPCNACHNASNWKPK